MPCSASSVYLTTLKRKEIAVRQLLGVEDRDLLLQFNREYLPLMVVAEVKERGIGRPKRNFYFRIVASQGSVHIRLRHIRLMISHLLFHQDQIPQPQIPTV